MMFARLYWREGKEETGNINSRLSLGRSGDRHGLLAREENGGKELNVN